jgi:hypothetical protein
MHRSTTSLWWTEDDDDATAAAVHSAVGSIKNQEGGRRAHLEACGEVYIDDPEGANYSVLHYSRNHRSRLPVLPGMVDAVLSRIGRAKPLPSVLTSDGNWRLKRKARLKTRWLAGMFKKLDVHTSMRGALHHALVFGTGCVKAYYDPEEEEIRAELVWAGDLHVEPLEAKHECVRTLYQEMAVDRGTLAEQYPEHKAEIDAAQPYETTSYQTGSTDLVLVIEAWRIGTKKTPGKHVICLANKCLAREDWKKKRFPFAFMRWRRKPRRWWGQGMIESGAGLQSLINSTADTLEECFRLSFPLILNQSGNGFRAESLSNTPWTCYEFDGVPPQFITPPAFDQSYVMYLQSLKTWLFETQGVSELAASSHKPAGLNSGKALLVFQDVETERFLIQGREFEEAHVALAELIIDIAEDIIDEQGTAEALRALGGRKALEATEYKDVRFADEPWAIQVYPVTSLSHSPSGRLEQIQEMIAVGAINDPSVVRELLDYPDLERYTSVESARRDLAEKLIDHALDKGVALPAIPELDLDYALKRGVLELNLAEMEGAPEKSRDALREFIGHVETLIEQQMPPMPPPGAPPMDASMGPPPMPGPPPEAMPPGMDMPMGPPGMPPMGPM